MCCRMWQQMLVSDVVSDDPFSVKKSEVWPGHTYVRSRAGPIANKVC